MTYGFNEYDDDHTLNARFALSAPLGFFVDLLRARLGLAVERGVVLGLSCALS